MFRLLIRLLSSIRNRVWAFFIANILLVIVNYGLTDSRNRVLEQDREYLEISKENEKFIERINFLTISTVRYSEEEKGLKELLKKEKSNFRDNLQALEAGGVAIVSGGRETIQIKSPANVGKAELRDLRTSWDKLSDFLDIIQNEKIKIDTSITLDAPENLDFLPADIQPLDEDTSNILELDTQLSDSNFIQNEDPIAILEAEANNTVSYFTETNPEVERAFYLASTALEEVASKNRELSEVYEDELNNSQSNLRFILLLTFLLNLSLLISGLIVFSSYLINPLKDISSTAKDVASGDINTQVKTRQDEIGEVANSLNLIVESFRQYTQFAENVGKGNFDSSFEVKSEKDTLGYTLLSMRDSLKKVAEEDKKRNWSNEGFTIFSNILRKNEQGLEEFSYEIISNLVKYMGANQGGLFIMETQEEESYLELKAAFAYNKRKYDEKQIKIGQGLLGQVVLDKELIYLEEAPNDYIQITSGLGKANPKHVLISPLKVNEEVLGAIEMASFHPFKYHEIEFVERLSENIASTLSSVNISKNTQKLLEETRQYAEQMQAQEEEMRQNMEMLSSTQSEMEKNQRKLEEYKVNLEKEVENRTGELLEQEVILSDTLSQLQAIIDSAKSGIVAIDNQYRVVSANTRVQEIIQMIYGTTFEVGDYWFNIFRDEKQRQANKELWDQALKGDYYNTETRFTIDPTLSKWFELSFNPIYNEQNEIIGASMFIRDVSLRKQNLRKTELTAHILDNSSNEVFVFNPETLKFTQVNERGRNNLGYTMEELADMTPYSIDSIYDRKSFLEVIEPLLKKEVQNLSIETEHIRKDGSTYEVEMNLQLFEDGEQDGGLLAAIAQDISQRKQNENQLKEALDRFDLATSATNEGVWEMPVIANDPINPDNPAWWSKRFINLLGFEENEFSPRLNSWSARLHPEDREKVLRQLYDYIVDTDKEGPFSSEYRLQRKDGEYIWFLANTTSQRNEKGQALKVVGSILDIHPRKKTELALKTQSAIVDGIFNASINSIISLDTELNILMANPATQRIFEYTEDEVLGKNLNFLIPEAANIKLEEQLEVLTELKAQRKSGKEIFIEMSVSKISLNDESRFVVILRDISQRKNKP